MPRLYLAPIAAVTPASSRLTHNDMAAALPVFSASVAFELPGDMVLLESMVVFIDAMLADGSASGSEEGFWAVEIKSNQK